MIVNTYETEYMAYEKDLSVFIHFNGLRIRDDGSVQLYQDRSLVATLRRVTK